MSLECGRKPENWSENTQAPWFEPATSSLQGQSAIATSDPTPKNKPHHNPLRNCVPISSVKIKSRFINKIRRRHFLLRVHICLKADIPDWRTTFCTYHNMTVEHKSLGVKPIDLSLKSSSSSLTSGMNRKTFYLSCYLVPPVPSVPKCFQIIKEEMKTHKGTKRTCKPEKERPWIQSRSSFLMETVPDSV